MAKLPEGPEWTYELKFDADQEAIDRVLPKARERGIGVIVKRRIANAAWLHSKRPPSNWYTQPYWDRLQLLSYDFLRRDTETAIATALRFTLGTAGVSTAIVGTTRPERHVARPEWTGQR